MGSASQSVEVNVSPEEFYKIVTDFENYPEFVSAVQNVEVLEKKGEEFTVAFELQLIKTVRYRLKMKGEPGKKLSWSLIDGDLFKVNNGSWILEPMKGGKGTRATYSTEVEFSMFVPKMITNKLAAVSLPTSLREFKERAESV